MSSYGNRCYTPERELITRRLVLAAMNINDVEFEELIGQVETYTDAIAIVALLAEQLAEHLTEGIECEHCIAEAARPIEARIAELERELGTQTIRRLGFGIN